MKKGDRQGLRVAERWLNIAAERQYSQAQILPNATPGAFCSGQLSAVSASSRMGVRHERNQVDRGDRAAFIVQQEERVCFSDGGSP